MSETSWNTSSHKHGPMCQMDPNCVQQSHVELRFYLQNVSAWLERICCITTSFSLQNHAKSQQRMAMSETGRNTSSHKHGPMCQMDPNCVQQSHVELRFFLQNISAWLERICCITTSFSLQNHAKSQQRMAMSETSWNTSSHKHGPMCQMDPNCVQQSHVELRFYLQNISAWLERICCITTSFSLQNHAKSQQRMAMLNPFLPQKHTNAAKTHQSPTQQVNSKLLKAITLSQKCITNISHVFSFFPEMFHQNLGTSSPTSPRQTHSASAWPCCDAAGRPDR